MRERNKVNSTLVARERSNLPMGRDVPKADRLVESPRGQYPAVGRKGAEPDPPRVALERS